MPSVFGYYLYYTYLVVAVYSVSMKVDAGQHAAREAELHQYGVNIPANSHVDVSNA